MASLRWDLRALLARVPTALFTIALGLAGLGGALRATGARFDAPAPAAAGAAILAVAGAILVLDVLLYTGKLLRARQYVGEDFGNATRANLVAPAFMAAMVIGSQLAYVSPAGRWLWIAAVSGHAFLLLRFVGRWLTHDYDPSALNPTWFLPAAGIMTASMTARGFWPHSLTSMVFAAGFVLWLALLPLVLRRLVFEPALDPPLRPTLFIVAAPAGLAANSILNLFPAVPHQVAGVFCYFGVFVIAALLAQPRFTLGAGVSLSWWATTFPVATVATGLLSLSRRSGNALDTALGLAILGLACCFTLVALVATVRVAWSTYTGSVEAARVEIAAMRGDPRIT